MLSLSFQCFIDEKDFQVFTVTHPSFTQQTLNEYSLCARACTPALRTMMTAQGPHQQRAHWATHCPAMMQTHTQLTSIRWGGFSSETHKPSTQGLGFELEGMAILLRTVHEHLGLGTGKF